MRIISFATEESEWKSPRMGIILNVNGRDSGHRLDCEKLFEPADRPANPLAWFDMDGRWFQDRARHRRATRARRRTHLPRRARKAGWCRARTRTGSRPCHDRGRSSASG